MSRLLWRRRTACFHCGTVRRHPCRGFERSGLIVVWQQRPAMRWVPWWAVRLIGSPPR